MKIALIAAVARNNVMGNREGMPWYLPADLRHFKQLTSGHTIIMGRHTYETLNKPLANRQNIVISRNKNLFILCVNIAHSIDEAIGMAVNEQVFIIGGAEIFKQTSNLADIIYITQIDTAIDGDIYFPVDLSEWYAIKSESHAADGTSKYAYTFVEYAR